MSAWQLMLLPFLECLVLVGIHSYLGIHVIKRKVIFVDLALAQIAALGTLAAFMFGVPPGTTGAYVFSLLFTFIGAAVFSLTRFEKERIPQEAIIGLVYAFAAAIAILVIDRAPHGAEHIKEVLTGSILWVSWQTVAAAAAIYAVVGVFHYVFRDKFLLISTDPQQAYAQGMRVRLWDFLFYMSFGLVITISVNTAGVLLVFVFLVVPAIMAISITSRLLYQLLIGWGVGVLVSFVGLVGSYVYDLPSGPMVVAVYAVALLLVALGLYVARSSRTRRAVAFIGVGVAVVLVAMLGFRALGGWLGALYAHPQDCAQEISPAVENSSSPPGAAAALLDKLSSLDIVEQGRLLEAQTDSEVLSEAAQSTSDEERRTALGRRLLALSPEIGRRLLLEEMKRGELPLFRSEALEALKAMTLDSYGYDPLDEPDSPANRPALEKWEAWLFEERKDTP